MYKRDIYLDIDDNLNNYIKSVELDSNSRVWHFHLTVDYEPLDLTGKSVQFRAEKPDKTNVLNDCKIVDAEKGVVEVKLTRQVNAIPGHVKCLLKIIGDEGFVLKTKTFVVDVSKTLSDDAVVSSDEFGALEAALAKVQDIDNRFAQTNAQLSEKASEQALAVERARIDNLTTLGEGSTTGDAELIDGRVDFLGLSHANLGNSIRNQFKNIVGVNTFSKEYTIGDNFNGILIPVDVEVLANQKIEIALISEEGAIIDNESVDFGVTYLDGVEENGIGKSVPNKYLEYLPKKDLKKIRCWIDGSAKAGNGKVILKVRFKEQTFQTLKKHEEEIQELNKSIEDVNKSIEDVKVLLLDENALFISKRFKLDGIRDVNLTVKGDFPQGKYYINIKNQNILADDALIYLAITYGEEEVSDVARFKPNEFIEVNLIEDASAFKIWCDNKYVIEHGSIDFVIQNHKPLSFAKMIDNLQEQIDILQENSKDMSGKKFSIIGDSYSTYKNWVPSGHSIWYSDTGNNEANDVSSVKQTWWWMLSDEMKMSLLINTSWSGSTICNTGYNGSDSSSSSFITRMKEFVGEKMVISEKPDVIFIFGGTNDAWAGAPVGELKYSDWTAEDLKMVLPAFCYMLDYLKTWNPHARIINIVNTGFKSSITNGMKSACEHYEVENVVLSDVGKESGHPNRAGMMSIKNQIKAIL